MLFSSFLYAENELQQYNRLNLSHYFIVGKDYPLVSVVPKNNNNPYKVIKVENLKRFFNDNNERALYIYLDRETNIGYYNNFSTEDLNDILKYLYIIYKEKGKNDKILFLSDVPMDIINVYQTENNKLVLIMKWQENNVKKEPELGYEFLQTLKNGEVVIYNHDKNFD